MTKKSLGRFEIDSIKGKIVCSAIESNEDEENGDKIKGLVVNCFIGNKKMVEVYKQFAVQYKNHNTIQEISK